MVNILSRCVVLLCSVWLMTACSAGPFAAPTPTPDPCSPDTLTAYAASFRPVWATYMGQVEVTSHTPRMSIGVPLQALFDQQQKVTTVLDTAPACVATWANQVRSTMLLYQQGMQQFAGGGDAGTVILAAQLGLPAITEGLTLLDQGTVPPAMTPIPAP